MKIAFISDIHGNAIALETVLNDLSEKNVDEVFVHRYICFEKLKSIVSFYTEDD